MSQHFKGDERKHQHPADQMAESSKSSSEVKERHAERSNIQTVPDTDKSRIMTKTFTSTPLANVLSSELSDGELDVGIFSNACTSAVTSRWEMVYKCVINNKFLCLGIVAVITCAIISCVLMEVLISRLKEEIKESLILGEKTATRWTQPNVNAYITIYMFEYIDPDDDIPTATEMEPRVYRLSIQKEKVTWHSNYSVSYQERYTFVDVADDGQSSRHNPGILPFITDMRNGVSGAMFNVYTGESSLGQIYQVFSWNYSRRLPFWNSEKANEIRGTDGSMFKPFLNEDTKLELFYPQLRRTFDLEFSESTTFKNLPVYRFTIKDSEFSNQTRSISSKVQATSHLNSDSTKMNHSNCILLNCVPSGIYQLWPERNGAAYISLPHFLGADPYYSQLVRGIHHDELKHRSIFEIDKVTGITVNQKRRFQMNIYQRFGNESEAYIPLYWFELSMEVTEDNLKLIKKSSKSFKQIYTIFVCVGLVLCLMFSALVCRLIYKMVQRRNTHDVQYMQLAAQPGRCCCRVCR